MIADQFSTGAGGSAASAGAGSASGPVYSLPWNFPEPRLSALAHAIDAARGTGWDAAQIIGCARKFEAYLTGSTPTPNP